MVPEPLGDRFENQLLVFVVIRLLYGWVYS